VADIDRALSEKESKSWHIFTIIAEFIDSTDGLSAFGSGRNW
jgi:hypothetical protein